MKLNRLKGWGFRTAVVVGLLGMAAVPQMARAQEHPIPPSQGVPEVHYVKVFGQQMAYYQMGSGSTLVLIHPGRREHTGQRSRVALCEPWKLPNHTTLPPGIPPWPYRLSER
jgi:hypothetical protein